jgi:hypothetical protein
LEDEMKLVTAVHATLSREPVGDLDDQDVRTVLFAAFPPLWGHGGVEVESIGGPDWLVTVPADRWYQIVDAGGFEQQVKLGDGTNVKMTIEMAPADDEHENYDEDELI